MAETVQDLLRRNWPAVQWSKNGSKLGEGKILEMQRRLLANAGNLELPMEARATALRELFDSLLAGTTSRRSVSGVYFALSVLYTQYAQYPYTRALSVLVGDIIAAGVDMTTELAKRSDICVCCLANLLVPHDPKTAVALLIAAGAYKLPLSDNVQYCVLRHSVLIEAAFEQKVPLRALLSKSPKVSLCVFNDILRAPDVQDASLELLCSFYHSTEFLEIGPVWRRLAPAVAAAAAAPLAPADFDQAVESRRKLAWNRWRREDYATLALLGDHGSQLPKEPLWADSALATRAYKYCYIDKAPVARCRIANKPARAPACDGQMDAFFRAIGAYAYEFLFADRVAGDLVSAGALEAALAFLRRRDVKTCHPLRFVKDMLVSCPSRPSEIAGFVNAVIADAYTGEPDPYVVDIVDSNVLRSYAETLNSPADFPAALEYFTTRALTSVPPKTYWKGKPGDEMLRKLSEHILGAAAASAADSAAASAAASAADSAAASAALPEPSFEVTAFCAYSVAEQQERFLAIAEKCSDADVAAIASNAGERAYEPGTPEWLAMLAARWPNVDVFGIGFDALARALAALEDCEHFGCGGNWSPTAVALLGALPRSRIEPASTSLFVQACRDEAVDVLRALKAAGCSFTAAVDDCRRAWLEQIAEVRDANKAAVLMLVHELEPKALGIFRPYRLLQHAYARKFTALVAACLAAPDCDRTTLIADNYALYWAAYDREDLEMLTMLRGADAWPPHPVL